MALPLKPACIGLLAIVLSAGGCSSDQEASPDPSPSVTSPAPTPEPSASETVDDAGPTFTAEEQEVADVFPLAFDTNPEIAAAAYAPDPELADILVAADEAAQARGDTTIGVNVTAVSIDGDLAEVNFDILLNGTAIAPSTGIALRIDGEWKVHLSTLCGLLSLAAPAPEGCERVSPAA